MTVCLASENKRISKWKEWLWFHVLCNPAVSVVPLRWCQRWWQGNLSLLYFNPTTQADKHKHSFTPTPPSSSYNSPIFRPEISSCVIAANSRFHLLNSEFYHYFLEAQQQTGTKFCIFTQVKVTWRNQKRYVMWNIRRDPYPFYLSSGTKQSKAKQYGKR